MAKYAARTFISITQNTLTFEALQRTNMNISSNHCFLPSVINRTPNCAISIDVENDPLHTSIKDSQVTLPIHQYINQTK